MTRHKHADVITAWVNDTSLEIEWWDPDTHEWLICGKPCWWEDMEYRIKPKKGDLICEINGEKWYLGPEASDPMTWADAKSWCAEQGCELPPREVLLMCYSNEGMSKQFRKDYYWSSTEYTINPAVYAWLQNFYYGTQLYTDKTGTHYVRGAFREEVK